MADTRKDRRAPVSLKVRFKSATVDEFIEHYCKDVSRGGIFIKSSQPMSIGTLLKFQFQLKDESSLIRGVGRVVWTRSPEDAVADQPAGMGIKFIKMDNESRAMVDRIVDGHGFDAGAYDEGRATASQAEAPSDFPPAGGSDNFFPDMPPAELPPPEDRTAVRQAAQFLAAALSEAGTDEAAAREAEQKAEEARQRTAQIEAARVVDAERKARAQQPQSAGSLPSMIIDPSLGSTEGKPTIPAPGGDPDSDSTPLPISQHPTVVAPSPLTPSSIPPAPYQSSPYPSDTPTASGMIGAPQLTAPAEAPKRSPLLPMAILAGVIGVAAYVATREKPAEVEPQLAPSAETAAQQPSDPAPGEPGPSPADQVAALPAPAEQALADAALAEQVAADAAQALQAAPEPQAADAVVAGAAVRQVDVDIRTVPKDAELLVGGVSRGTGSQVIPLPEGQTVTVTARAPGHSELSREIKPRAGLLPVKLVLPSLPYVVRVVTTPPGARVSAGPSKRGTSPTDLVVGAPLHGDVGVIARLPGYESARVTLKADDFAPTTENNIATLNLSLNPLPKAPVAPPAPVRPKPVAPKPQPVEGANDKPEGSDAAPSVAPTPTQGEPVERPIGKPPEPAPEKPAEPAPATPEKPKPEAVPANPFG
jgi:uncharacterized protein (TIGR02266 family)